MLSLLFHVEAIFTLSVRNTFNVFWDECHPNKDRLELIGEQAFIIFLSIPLTPRLSLLLSIPGGSKMPAFHVDGLPFLLIAIESTSFLGRSVRRRSGEDGLKRFDD